MVDQQLFEEYLASKKIDASKFKNAEASLYDGLKKQFDQMHPNSFTAQKLFIINPLRRKYLLAEVSTISDKPKSAVKPKFKKPS